MEASLQHEIEALRERLRIAESENRELKGEHFVSRLRGELKLSWNQAVILAALLQNESLTYQKLGLILFGEYAERSYDAIRNYIVRIRYKLKPHKIFVTTCRHKGDGYYLHPTDKAKLRELIAL